MSPSKRIAGLVGPTLIAITISETVNLDIWKANDPRLTYLNGTLVFVGGLAIVRAHNVWVRAWPVLLTLVGWLAMAAGVFRMFAPNATQGGENPPTYAVIATLCAVGVVLTIQAYRPGGEVSHLRESPNRGSGRGCEGGSTVGNHPHSDHQAR